MNDRDEESNYKVAAVQGKHVGALSSQCMNSLELYRCTVASVVCLCADIIAFVSHSIMPCVCVLLHMLCVCTAVSHYHSPLYSIPQMTLYVFFPVAVFYYFNRPEYFDREVEEARVRGSAIRIVFTDTYYYVGN